MLVTSIDSKSCHGIPVAVVITFHLSDLIQFLWSLLSSLVSPMFDLLTEGFAECFLQEEEGKHIQKFSKENNMDKSGAQKLNIN